MRVLRTGGASSSALAPTGDARGLREAGHGVLGHLGITLDDATLAGPWQSGTRTLAERHSPDPGKAALAEDDTPTAGPGGGYAGEGPGPPGTCFSSSEG
ncbi:hypothetical protein GCM10022285_25380 [Streptomyces tunisiensis]|uniref:Uncharacterized protein n=1 Tax=Streptomyces tunisiensis TaxID=948699 RepID=A0ABP7YBJ2_9ACTN